MKSGNKIVNSFITELLNTKIGQIPKVSTTLNQKDKCGTLKARTGINRNNYKVEPGLYAVGNPDENSRVLVTANYKLSFDTLRKELEGFDLWILVIDTKGINVWCAAGKGTFGTEELLNRIKSTALENLVSHRKLIIPQLGAPGVSSYKIKELSGFNVIYGPIRANDLPVFINNGLKATEEMRKVTFSFKERLVLLPVEIYGSFKIISILLLSFIILSGLNNTGYSFNELLTDGLRSLVNLLFAYTAGLIIGPLLLPWLPGKSFALKGMVSGLLLFGLSFLINFTGRNLLEVGAWLFIIMGLSSYGLMNFTGSTPYTSLSGVKKELRIFVPIQIAFGVIGLGLWITANFVILKL